MDRQEWLKRRKVGIGGSEVSAILGINPWMTALDVYNDKVGAGRDEPENESMRIGTALEQFVADRFTQETGRKTSRFNRLLQVGHSIGNVDRLVVPDGAKLGSFQNEVRTDELLECKTSSKEWPDGVPAHYLSQVQHYMGLDPAFKRATVAVLFLGFDKRFQTYLVERDDALIRSMQDAVEAFWTDHVEKRVPPPPQTEEDCRKLWLAHEPGKIVEADEKLADTARQLAALTAEIKAREEEAKELRGMLMAAIGDGDTLVFGSEKLCTWKNNKPSNKVNWEALATSLNPADELVQQFTETKPGARIFRLAVK